MAKQRLTYAQFVAQQKTVAGLIHRFIAEMDGTPEKPGVRSLGSSHRFSLKKLAVGSLGVKIAAELTKADIIGWCKERTDISAATRGQYIGYLSGVLKYARSAWEDCTAVSDLPIQDAKPLLNKHNLLGKSTPRDRRPTDEEHSRLIALFEEQNKRERNRIDMVRMARWQRASSRRVGESCALLWEDWRREDHTILVRKMKDPKRRNKQKVVALPVEAQAMLVELWETRDPNEPRIFPFNSHSVSARYTEAKHILGIENLRLHDSRRDCCSRLIEQGYTSAEAVGFSGHETTQVFERTYMRPKPERLKNGPANLKRAA